MLSIGIHLVVLAISQIAGPGSLTGAQALSGEPSAGLASDFNADGYADLAIGIPLEDVGAVHDAGAVAILYGSPDGPQAEAPADQLLVQGSEGIGDSPEPKDQLGSSLDSGDFNGDGFFDLAVGGPLEDVLREDGSRNVWNAGALHVLYGSDLGLQADPSDVQVWSQETPGIIGLAEGGDGFGSALAASDLDGDGFDDLAVGVPGEDAGAESIPRAGALNVIYGSPLGLGSAGDQHLDQDDVDFHDAAEPHDSLGRSLAAADFNADGYADLAAGIPGEDLGDANEAGAVHVLYGSADGLQATAPDDQFWTQGAPEVLEQPETGDALGEALVSGDFDGDGFADLAAGVPGEDLDLVTNAGLVMVLHGGEGGLQATDPEDSVWSEESPDVDGHAARGDGLGSALGAGDFDGDGTDDLAIGVPRKDVGPRVDSGVVHVLYGSGEGLQATDPVDQVWSQGGALRDGAESGDLFGWAVGMGDYSGDGLADLSIGVPREDRVVSDSGAAVVLLAAAGGLQAEAPDDQFWDQDSAGVEDRAEGGDSFGWP